MLPLKPFYMIRHGESEANKEHVFAGHIDSPLTDLGRSQAEQARIILESLPIKPDLIAHSHLSRARDTALIMDRDLKIPMYEDPDLAEIFYGEQQGQTITEENKTFIHTIDPPGGETHEEFKNRILRGISNALNKAELVLITGHGGCF